MKFTAGMYGMLNVGRLHQTAAAQRRVEARRRLRPVNDPFAKRDKQRPLGMDKRIAVGAQLAGIRETRQHRRWLRERIAPAMLRAGEIVDPHLVRNPRSCVPKESVVFKDILPATTPCRCSCG